MAVYQGARIRAGVIGAPGVPASGLPTPLHIPATARPRIRPAAAVVLAILVVSMLAFAYLTQTLASAATGVEIDRLRADAADLQRLIKSQSAVVTADASAGNVRERAAELGLVELGKSITLRAP